MSPYLYLPQRTSRLSHITHTCRLCTWLLVVCLIALSAISAEAQEPNAAPMPQTQLTRLVTETLSPYLMVPARRDPREEVSLMDQKIEIWRLESFERGDISAKLCAATRALIFGRLARSRGVKALFNEAPYIDVVELVFYRKKTQVDPDLSGAYQQTATTQITARLSLSRSRALTLDLNLLRSTLSGATCVAQARDLLDDVWISEKTTERRSQLRDAALELRARMKRPPVTRQ